MFSESKLEDIPRYDLDAVLCRFFAEIRKEDGHEYETERLAVMSLSASWTVILKNVAETTVFCEIVNLQIH